MEPLRVAVVGAGIAGLAVAHGLQRDGHDVVVLERGRADRRQGSGLSLFPNGLRALASLGLAPAVESLTGGAPPTEGGLRTASGRRLAQAQPEVLAGMRVVHREELHAALTSTLTSGTVRHDTAVTDVGASTGRVRTATDDITYDLVVGADGLRSPTRSALMLDPGIRWAGYGAWRGVTRAPLPGVEAGELWGRGLRLGVVPMPDGRVYWFAVRGGPREPGTTDHARAVLDLFDGWAAPVREVVEATDPASIGWSPIDELERVPDRFHHGRTVLVGDAAHAMTPNLGQGGNQALEDAATLVALIAGRPLDAALERYSELRVPRTREVHRRSRAVGRVAQARHPWTAGLRDLLVGLVPDGAGTRTATAFTDWAPPEVDA